MTSEVEPEVASCSRVRKVKGLASGGFKLDLNYYKETSPYGQQVQPEDTISLETFLEAQD